MTKFFWASALAAAAVLAGCGNDKPPPLTVTDETVERAKQHREQIEELLEQYFVNVDGGMFMMGCAWEKDRFCGYNEEPAHSVALSDFLIGRHELTQRLWELVMGDNPSEEKGGDLPVTNVSWDDIQLFVSTLKTVTNKNYRLPTEAEWEFAARGGNNSEGYRYSGGNEHGDVAWYASNSGGKIHQVGSKQPNELGIHDMTGNVREWVYDWYAEEYDPAPAVNPAGPAAKEARRLAMTSNGPLYMIVKMCVSVLVFRDTPFSQFGPFRVVRGGSRGDSDDGVYNRSSSSPDNRNDYTGFRLARDAASGKRVPSNAALKTAAADTLVSPPDVSSNPDFIAMAFVRGGTFTMGRTPEQYSAFFDDETSVSGVAVGDFYIGKYEITQGLWKAVMGGFPSGNGWGSRWSASVSSKYGIGDNCPVYFVSWNDVQNFIRKLNAKTGKKYRLPTEAEWEFAARGGNRSRGYTYSGGNDIDDVAWYGKNSGYYMNGKVQPAGTKAPNELGVYDMSGNVSEWLSDRYGDYPQSGRTDPKGPSSGKGRVFRGGCRNSHDWGCRVSFRRGESRNYRYSGLGFRLALDP